MQFALYHTWTFADRVIVADGGPDLDLLRGDAIGSSGGTSRHQVEAQAGYANNGLGLRLSGNWRSATRVNGGTPGNPNPLEFGSLATVDFRLFADLGQRLELLKKHPWLRGTRVSLVVDNVFNQRQRVTDLDRHRADRLSAGLSGSAGPDGAAVGPQAVLLRRRAAFFMCGPAYRANCKARFPQDYSDPGSHKGATGEVSG
ncbi:hypothetical protein P0F65_14300 [Sphingomonas sp. I4]